LSVPHRKYITSPLRARHVNATYRFVTKLYQCNYHTSGHYPSSCLLFKTQLDSIALAVPYRKNITSPLRAQQVNAIYRFVAMVYEYDYHNYGHYSSFCLLFKTQHNSIALSVHHRKHMSPLRAQQVNAIYRFVMMIYQCNYHTSGHYPSPCLLFKTQLNSIALAVPHRKKSYVYATSPTG
jgi:hypothetical protein